MRVSKRCGAGALVALAGACALPLAASADDAVAPRVVARPGVLNLRTGNEDTARLANLLTQPGAAFEKRRRYVLMLDGPMDRARRGAMEGLGIRIDGYLPLHAFVVDASATTPAEIVALGFVTWVGEYRDEWKVDAGLLAADGRAWATATRQGLQAAGKRAVGVWLFGHSGSGATEELIRSLPGAAIHEVRLVGDGYFIGATVRAEDAALIGMGADVRFIEEQQEYSARSNLNVRWIVQSNNLGQTPLYARGLTGAGEVMGVIDGWIGSQHCAFLDTMNPIGSEHRKIVAYNTPPAFDGHGTHVACTAAGDSGTEDNARGVAYAARIAFNIWPEPTEASVFGRFNLHYTQGARVHTNSWGTDFTTAYDGACRAIDSIQHDLEDQLIVHAVSNGSFVKNPENAKNSLAVAATGAAGSQDNMCSGGAGPTDDGRRKPEITAPGCNTLSAAGMTGCAVGNSSGTSMATPAVSGVAVLTRQYYNSGFYPSGTGRAGDAFVPSGSLLKATLVNSAADMAGVAGFPGVREGWGRVLADDALFFAGDARNLVVRDVRNADQRALSTGESHEFAVNVAAAAQSYKVTLAYADAPAAENATFAPVNNLDLVVIDPMGQTYFGNVFLNSRSTTGGSRDAINNLEQVLLVNPTPGVWRVRIEGMGVNVGAQGYALVMTGAISDASCVGDITLDGGVTIEDLLLYLALFEEGSVLADLDDGSGMGTRDGGVTIEDLLYFLVRFDAGC